MSASGSMAANKHYYSRGAAKVPDARCQLFFCSSCGARVDPNVRFCRACGRGNMAPVPQQVRSGSVPLSPYECPSGRHHAAQREVVPVYQERRRRDEAERRHLENYYSRAIRLSVDPQTALNHVTGRLQSSATIWLLIGILQVLVGLGTLFVGVGVLPLAIGIWNLVNSSRQRRAASDFARRPIGIISACESGKTTSIVFIFVNFLFGALFGVLGAIYDLSTCSYVLSHRDAFEALERNARYC